MLCRRPPSFTSSSSADWSRWHNGSRSLFLRREQIPWKRLLYGLGVLAALVAPAAWYVITRDQGQINWVPRPSLLQVYHVLTFLVSNGRKGLCNFLLLAYAAGFSLAIRAFCLALRRGGRTLANWHQALILCGFAGPIAISLVLSVWKLIFFKRFLFVCLPSLVMLVAAGIAQVRSPRLLAVAVMYAAVCSAGTVWYWYGRPNEPWRDAAGYVYGAAHAGDVLVFHKPWSGHAAFDYYRGRMQHLPGPAASWSSRCRTYCIPTRGVRPECGWHCSTAAGAKPRRRHSRPPCQSATGLRLDGKAQVPEHRSRSVQPSPRRRRKMRDAPTH